VSQTRVGSCHARMKHPGSRQKRASGDAAFQRTQARHAVWVTAILGTQHRQS
jgi:hypothetical protein